MYASVLKKQQSAVSKAVLFIEHPAWQMHLSHV